MAGFKKCGEFATVWVGGLGLLQCEEIVRCKDCKGYRAGEPCGWCNTHMTAIPREDGFCAWGKRREERCARP